MYISHKYKYIFYHLHKTAGTSIEFALRKREPIFKRLIISFFSNNIFTRNQKIKNISRRFIAFANNYNRPYRKLDIFKDCFLNPINNFKNQPYITEIKELNKEIFNDYFKFAFVRNPYDWHVSVYHYFRKEKNHPENKLFSSFNSFTEYIKYLEKNKRPSQLDFISDNKGNLLIDYICRFENLQEDFNRICRILKIKQIKLPHFNINPKKDYKTYYTEETSNILYNLYKEEFRVFDYKRLKKFVTKLTEEEKLEQILNNRNICH